MDIKDFGAYLKSLREKNKLTLTELGDLIDYSNPYLSQIENGRRKSMPNPELLRKLAKVYGIDPIDLMVKAGHLEEAEHEGMMKSAEEFRRYRDRYGMKDIADVNDQDIVLEDLLTAAYLNTAFMYEDEPLDLEKKVFIAHFLEVLLKNEMPIDAKHREKILEVVKVLLK